MSATTHERRGKLLSDQIDRLDAMLDGLAEGLNDAIADAAREGGRQAVLALLADPAFLRAVRGPAPEQPPSHRSTWRPRFTAGVAAGCMALSARASAATTASRRAARMACGVAASVWARRAVLGLSVLGGLLVAVATLLAHPLIGAGIAGFAGAITVLAFSGRRSVERHTTATEGPAPSDASAQSPAEQVDEEASPGSQT